MPCLRIPGNQKLIEWLLCLFSFSPQLLSSILASLPPRLSHLPLSLQEIVCWTFPVASAEIVAQANTTASTRVTVSKCESLFTLKGYLDSGNAVFLESRTHAL